MIYRKFGKTGWEISAVGQGCWNIGNQWGEMTDEEAIEIIRTGVENGINLFDVAESYGIPNGLSEIRLGKALKGIRNNVYIVSKIGYWGTRTGQAVPKTTPDMIRCCGHACAGRLKTDYIDIMLCHEMDIKDPSIYIEGFRQLKAEGYIKEYGISTNDFEVFKNFYEMSDGECSVLELDYSIINQEPEKEIFPFCKEHNIALIARGVLAMGLLSGKYDENSVFTDQVRKKWNKGERDRIIFEQKLEKVNKVRKIIPANKMVETAIRFVISNELNIVAIPGATSSKQVLSNCKAGENILDSCIYDKLKKIL